MGGILGINLLVHFMIKDGGALLSMLSLAKKILRQVVLVSRENVYLNVFTLLPNDWFYRMET